MDSKNIFIACRVMQRKVNWEKNNDNNEWPFVRSLNEFQLDMVQNKLNNFFMDDKIYFVTDRHNSKEIIKKSAALDVKNILIMNQNVTLCSKDFKQFIVFNFIGIAKQGKFM